METTELQLLEPFATDERRSTQMKADEQKHRASAAMGGPNLMGRAAYWWIVSAQRERYATTPPLADTCLQDSTFAANFVLAARA